MPGMAIKQSVFAATIDIEAEGKHFGHVLFPDSRDDAGWGHLMVPIVTIRNGDGPCAVLIAGNHGDEYEGQVALRNFVRTIDPSEVTGSIIVLPSLNTPAVYNDSRCSPIDKGNLNRLFPGNSHGTMTQKIASYVVDQIIPRADYVLDLHSGGRTYNFIPCAMFHRRSYLQSDAIFETTRRGALAFSAPVALILDEPDRIGLLDSVVEDMGIPFVCTELGGGATLSKASVEISKRGIYNTLRLLGSISGIVEEPEVPTRLMETPEGAFVIAEDSGIFEPFFELGDEVPAGAPVGQLHSISHPGRDPVVYRARAGGVLVARRIGAKTNVGDVVTCVARDY